MTDPECEKLVAVEHGGTTTIEVKIPTGTARRRFVARPDGSLVELPDAEVERG